MCSERSTGRISPTSVASGYAFGSRRGLEALWKRRTAETRSRRQRGRRRKWSVCSEFTRRRHRPQQPAPPRPLPDAAGRLGLLAERDGRRLERRLGQLQRLSAVVDRPRRLRGGDGRDLDRLRQRLGDPGAWASSSTTSRSRMAAARRSRAGSKAGRSAERRGQRSERERLDRHRRGRLPGRRLDHDAALAPDGLRLRGDHLASAAQRGDGADPGPPARLTARARARYACSRPPKLHRPSRL